MNVLEHEEIEAPLEHPVAPVAPNACRQNERKMEVVGVVWQVFRLLLLAWSLLCFYCCLRLCLAPRGVDFVSVASNLIIGLLAWTAACRIGQPMEWVEENDADGADEAIGAVDAK